MPTPIGHALAGIAVSGVARRFETLTPRQAGVLVFCAAAPDLDLLLRLVDGVNHHRGPSHSFAAAILVGLAISALGRVWKGSSPSGRAAAAAWASHVVLDYLGVDTSPPVGEMALWPFSDAFFASPVSLFYDVPRSFSPEAIRHNLLAVLIEVLVLVPVALLCWGRRKPRAS